MLRWVFYQNKFNMGETRQWRLWEEQNDDIYVDPQEIRPPKKDVNAMQLYKKNWRKHWLWCSYGVHIAIVFANFLKIKLCNA